MTALDAAAENDDVERVTVGGHRARHHSVVGRIGEVVQDPPAVILAGVDPYDAAALLVDLELGGGSARDFDDRVDRRVRVARRVAARVVAGAGDGLGVERDGVRRNRSAPYLSAHRNPEPRDQHQVRRRYFEAGPHSSQLSHTPALRQGHDLGHRLARRPRRLRF